jgi:hypothetical protein
VATNPDEAADSARALFYSQPPEGVPDPPPCPKEAITEWTQYDKASRLNGTMGSGTYRGVLWVLSGKKIADAAEFAGVKDTNAIRAALKRYDLTKFQHKTAKLIELHRGVAYMAMSEIHERLEDKPEEFKDTKALAVVGAISTDKVLAYEKEKNTGGNDFCEGLRDGVAYAAEKFMEAGGTLTLTVSAGNKDAIAANNPEEIDVTPKAE